MGRPRTKTKNPGVIAENVLRLRLKSKLTQQQLADECGVSRGTIACVELGTYVEPELSTLVSLAKALGTTVDALRQPQGRTAALEPYIEAFRSSPWAEALRPTEDELRWLSSLPKAVYWGLEPTPHTIARLLEWHRSGKSR